MGERILPLHQLSKYSLLLKGINKINQLDSVTEFLTLKESMPDADLEK